MPSWIKIKDGIEWYDELFTIRETNQSPEQLAKKAKKGKVRRFKQRNGPYWYARPDVEALREAFLKRSAAAKGRKISDAALEARYTRNWEREMDRDRKRRQEASGSAGPARLGPLAAHQERAMLMGVDRANAMRRKSDKDGDTEPV